MPLDPKEITKNVETTMYLCYNIINKIGHFFTAPDSKEEKTMKKGFTKFIGLAAAAGMVFSSLLPSAAETYISSDLVPNYEGVYWSEEAEKGRDPSFVPDLKNATCLVVASDGDDGNVGTFAKPFKTLEKARETARASSADSVTVYIRGDFTLTEPFVLDQRDEGDVYASYPDSPSAISGAKSYNLASARRVTDEKILSSLEHSEVADRLYTVNLWNLCPDMTPSDIPSNRSPLTFNINSSRELSMSAYPENGFLKISEKTGDYSFKVEDEKGRLAAAEAFGSEIMGSTPYWFGGYPGNDWSYYTAGADIDFSSGVIEDKTKQSHYGINVGQRIFFYNLISEINSPTDYAIDADRNLYFTLEDGETPENSSLFINGYKGNLFEVKGNNITVSGLKFSGVYDGSAVSVTAEGCTVKNCLFEEIQNGTAVTAKGNKNKVLNCFFNRLGASCVTVEGGTLSQPSENSVFNCDFSGWGRANRTYTHAVAAYGSGAKISHNNMFDAPHLAIYLEGTNHTVEYNKLQNICTETSDAGAIYTGRSYFNRGNVIRYNFFENIIRCEGAQSGFCSAVYQDDCGSAFDVYGNIFVSCDRAFLIGGGRDNVFENNILASCGDGEATPYSGDADARGIIWGNNPADFDAEADKALLESELYRFYPEIAELWEDGEEFCYPKGNVIRNNVLYNSDPFKIDERVEKYGDVSSNVHTADNGIFENFSNGKYQPSENIRNLISDFPLVDADKFGRTEQQPTDEEEFFRDINTVNGEIAALPEKDKATKDDLSAVLAVKKHFDRLLAGQKKYVTDYDKLFDLLLVCSGKGEKYEQKVLWDGEDISGWHISDGFESGFWTAGSPSGSGYFVMTGAGLGVAEYSFSPADFSSAEDIRFFVYVVDPDDLKSVELCSGGGTLELDGLEGFTPTVGGWSEISLKIDKKKSDGGFDIKNVTSVRFKSEVAIGALALIGYDNIRITLKTPEFEQGDVDADGSITVTDALMTLQYSVGKITFSDNQLALADMNGDDKATVTDALIILQKAVAPKI